MPRKKGAKNSAIHNSRISKGVAKFNSGSLKKRDGVLSNNEFPRDSRGKKIGSKRVMRGGKPTPSGIKRSTEIDPKKVAKARKVRDQQQAFTPYLDTPDSRKYFKPSTVHHRPNNNKKPSFGSTQRQYSGGSSVGGSGRRLGYK